jgi:D-alanyl-D-alanine carboxypeptidase (penicillin-binding protein 5/6)
LPIGVSRDLYVTVPRGQYEKLAANVEVDPSIVAPVQEGERRGTVTLKLGENLLAEHPLVALQSVAEGSLWQRMSDNVKLLFQ